MKILIVTSEVAPFSRSGGLGLVCASLPAALAALGHHLIVVSPRYRHLEGPEPHPTDPTCAWWLGGTMHHVRYAYHPTGPRLLHVFVDNPMFDRDGYYADSYGDYGDNLIRFALLCRAAIEAPHRLGLWKEPDVIHSHDWQASLTPCFINALYRPLGLYAHTRTVLTLHNAAHQGRFPQHLFPDLDLAPRHRPTLAWGDHMVLLKGGLESADQITAVSPTFARELCTQTGGFGLDTVMRRKQERLTGILNGIDTEQFNPATDPHLPAHFDASDPSGKAQCKAHLQRELGLPEDPRAPLFVLNARLVWQKGIDLVCDAFPEAAKQGAQLVVMGGGERLLEERIKALADGWPHAVRTWFGFDHALSLRMYAGADVCLVPSRFEPCGLSQLYAMRYGALPLVRRTGGLRDTVTPWDAHTSQGTGFCFDAPTPEGLQNALHKTLETWYHDQERWKAMRRCALLRDSGWGSAAKAYLQVYQSHSEPL